MAVAKITEVKFTSADRVRDVMHNFNTDGFASLYPKYKGGRPKTFTLPERREIKKIAKSKPTETLTLAELGIEDERAGTAGSRTSVLALGPPPAKGDQIKIEEDGSAAEQLVDWLAGRKLL